MTTHSDIAAYDRDGVVRLRQAFDAASVERLRGAVERDLAERGLRRGRCPSDEGPASP